ncbi:MAG: FkbM family methyltransferase [Acidobacteriota bacterium]|nr:FkbM family methyltransferase [Acidobacteriota bacterium]
MSLRKSIKKWVYGYVPGMAGRFRYYGTKVHFRPASDIWPIWVDEGIYEARILALILGVVRPATWYFDIGTNIGLMSVPILHAIRDAHVVSFEPSRNSRMYLKKTWESSPYRDRWKVIEKAVSDTPGHVQFNLSAADHAGYDGIKPTARTASIAVDTVEATTLDAEWQALGRPPVSCIKMDVEGAEMMALRGAQELIATTRPYIFLEWYEQNFRPFGCTAEQILEEAERFDYDVINVDTLSPVISAATLALSMRLTASFVLAPRGGSGRLAAESTSRFENLESGLRQVPAS